MSRLAADIRDTVAAEGGAAFFAAKVVITIAVMLAIAWGLPVVLIACGAQP